MSKTLKAVLTIICIMILSACSMTMVFAFASPRDLRTVPNYNFVKVVQGKGHVLALNSEGKLYGWGLNDFGQVTAVDNTGGEQLNKYIAEPVQINVGGSGVVTDIAACDKSSAAISDERVYTWGSSISYQNGTNNDITTGPFLLAGIDYAKSITAGDLHYAVSAEISPGSAKHQIKAWGSNSDHQIDNSSSTQLTPQQISNEVVPNSSIASLNNTYYLTGSENSGTWININVTAIGKSATHKTSTGTNFNTIDKIFGIGDAKVAFRESGQTVFKQYDASTGVVSNYNVTNDSNSQISIENIAVAKDTNNALQLSYVTGNGDVYSSGTYGIGQNTPEANKVKLISFQNGAKMTFVSGGENSFIFIDTTGSVSKSGRVHIVGERTDSEIANKFPNLSVSATAYSDGRIYPQAYNFVRGINQNTTQKRISVYDGTNENGASASAESVYYFSSNELINNDSGECGEGSSAIVKDKYEFLKPTNPTDTTISLNTHYGIISVNSSKIKESDSADAVKIEYVVNGGLSKVKISGNKKLVKDKTFTVVIPLFETINSTTQVNNIYRDLVEVHYVEIQFVFENWAPEANVTPTEFKGDANAIGNDKKPIDSQVSTADFSYKKMVLEASSIVTDKDNNMGVNNNPNSLKFTGLADVEYSSDISAEHILLVFNTAKNEVEIIAKKSFVGTQQIKFTVEDDYNSRIQVMVNVSCKAKSCSNFEGSTVFSDGIQSAAPNVITLSQLYSDSGDLIFENLLYNTAVGNVELSADKTQLTVTSNSVGKWVVSGDIKSKSDATDSSPFNLYVEFAKNAAPSLKADVRSLEFSNTLEKKYLIGDLFSDAEGQSIDVTIISSGSKNIVTVNKATDGSLRIKPEKQGEDIIQFLISDGVPGNQVAVNIKVKVLNAYVASVVKLTMSNVSISSGYLASFATGENFSLADLSAAVFEGTPADNELVNFKMSVDTKSLTLVPKQMGKQQITIVLNVSGRRINVELPINVLTFMPATKIDIDVAELKKNGKGTTYSLSIEEFINNLGIVDYNGVPLNPSSFEFVRVNLKGSEKYALATVNQERTILDIQAIGNTPNSSKLGETREGEGEGGGEEELPVPESEIEYVEVVIKEVNGFSEYFIAMPITVTGLKLYPSNGEYQLIFFISLGVSLGFVIILMIIARVRYASNSAKYRKEIEKVKMRDKMKKAKAVNQRQQSVSIAARASMMNGMGMSVPMQNMAPNPSMQQRQSMGSPQGASQMPPPPPQSQQADPDFDKIAIEGRGGKKRNTEMPPLKANQKVPKNARDEIDYKIQQKLAAQQSQPQQMPHPEAQQAQQPKMSKQDKKKQELMEKLRAKMMSGK